MPAGGAAAHRPGPGAADGLGRDQDVGPGDDVGEQVAEGALALAVAVDVGGVDQRAAGVDERRQLHGGLVLVGVAAPRHGAERQPGHDQATAPQRPLLHERPTYRWRADRPRRATPAGDTRCAAPAAPAGPAPRLSRRLPRRPAAGRALECPRASSTAPSSAPHSPAGADRVSWFEAVVLGVVQGLTEFLPISSSAHLRIVGEAFGWDDPGAAFTAITQIGTELAVLVYFRRDIGRIIARLGRLADRPRAQGRPRRPHGLADHRRQHPDRHPRAAVPGRRSRRRCATCGSSRSRWSPSRWSSTGRPGRAPRSGELERPHRRRTASSTGSPRRWRSSRASRAPAARSPRGCSSATPGAAAARYSFLLAIPAVLGSGLYEAYKALKGDVARRARSTGGRRSWPPCSPSASGSSVIAWLLRYLNRGSFTPFVVYRIVLGPAGARAWSAPASSARPEPSRSSAA